MKVEFEIITPDEGCSFRMLHQKVPISEFIWQYHYHPEVEIVSVINGVGTRHVGNHLSHYQHGDLVLIGPNLPHSGFGLHASDPHEEIVLQIKEEVLFPQRSTSFPEMKTVDELLNRSKYGIAFHGKTKKDVEQRLVAIMSLPPFDKYVQMLSVFQSLAISQEYELLNKEALQPPLITKHKMRLQKIFTYVEQHFDEDINIGAIAFKAGLSVPSFCNYFKKTTNITFTEFVNKFRVQKACLLLQQDKTIAEVSFECGFNNITYFNKVFKSILNKTPGEFRREMELI